eukprot:2527687-Karenia_brevis.AAC.1
MRRDIAMLGLLHKISLGTAPEPLCNLFRPRTGTLDTFGFQIGLETHCRQLHDPVAVYHPAILQRSAFGLVRVYNRLPHVILDSTTPKVFQKRLQNKAKAAAEANIPDWESMFHAR